MSVSKVKTAVIIILAALNLLFFALLLKDVRSEAVSRSLELKQISEMYADCGVKLGNDVNILRSLPTVAYARDHELERSFAELFLGETTENELGADSRIYYSGAGTCLFRSGGEFTVYVKSELLRSEQSIKWVKRTLRSFGEFDIFSVTQTVSGFRVIQSFGGREITNCEILFTFSDGRLESVSGRLATSFDETESSMSCVTALTRFLSYVRSGAIPCSEVTDMVPVYIMDDTESTLYGVWQMITDTGIYTVNAATGEIITKS